MLEIREAIVVEGRYDKNTLSQIVDAPILETSGFGIFKDKEQMSLLRRVAERRGLIVFTDSDGAGFVIRNHIKSSIPARYLKHAYIPDILIDALRRAGATIEGEETVKRQGITKQDLMAWGLSGGANSAQKRQLLLRRLGLPQHMSTNAMLQALNLLCTPEELADMLESL